jgi:hypothetical protein
MSACNVALREPFLPQNLSMIFFRCGANYI